MPGQAKRPAGELAIPPNELRYQASRSGGPGGQHVNKTSTRVELWWNLETSQAVTEEERSLLRSRLSHRLDSEGWIRLVESGTRSQLRNRERVTERLAELVTDAATPIRPRKRTGPPRAAKERRLTAKRRRSEVKSLRGRVRHDD